MKHIVLFAQNLDIGGVQKSVVNLANFLVKFYKVSIILAESNKKIAYKLNKKIKIITIKTKKIDVTRKYIGLKLFKYRIKELDKILKKIKPTIVLSFEDYNNFILFNTKYKTVKVGSVRISSDFYIGKKIHLLDEDFYRTNRKLYKKFKTIVVSKAIAKDLPNSKLIYNGIESKKDLKNLYENYILNVARLHLQKGQKDLINAFKLISQKIDEDLIIVGDGVLKQELDLLIKELKLEDRVKLVGFDNPYRYFKNAKLFVFPSYYEGFANALLEAMKKNIPIIAYNFKGSEEILEKRVSLGNVESLANEIYKALKNEKYKKELLEQNRVVKEFSLHKTLREYKKVLDIAAKDKYVWKTNNLFWNF